MRRSRREERSVFYRQPLVYYYHYYLSVHSEDKETEKIHERINSLLNILFLANNGLADVSNNRNES